MLAVAGEVFAERGFHAASMDEIAERADISKPMLYAYFGSKEGLYSAYMERVGGELLAAMDAAVDPELAAGRPGARLDDRVPRLRRRAPAGLGGAAARARRRRAGRWPPTSRACARRSSSAWRRCSRSSSTTRARRRARATASSAPASRWRPGGSTIPRRRSSEMAARIMEVGWIGVGGVLEGRRWPARLAGLPRARGAVAARRSTSPSYDPTAWLIWGRELTRGRR